MYTKKKWLVTTEIIFFYFTLYFSSMQCFPLVKISVPESQKFRLLSVSLEEFPFQLSLQITS
jgi:hypothetical protein